MLEDLKVLNGTMSLDFDSLNNIYTISVEEDVQELDLDYKVSTGYNISIIGNNLTNNLNEVVISVYNDEEVNSYYLYVTKEVNVAQVVDNNTNLEIKEEINPLVLPSIASLCFIIILLLFVIIYKNKKN